MYSPLFLVIFPCFHKCTVIFACFYCNFLLLHTKSCYLLYLSHTIPVPSPVFLIFPDTRVHRNDPSLHFDDCACAVLQMQLRKNFTTTCLSTHNVYHMCDVSKSQQLKWSCAELWAYYVWQSFAGNCHGVEMKAFSILCCKTSNRWGLYQRAENESQERTFFMPREGSIKIYETVKERDIFVKNTNTLGRWSSMCKINWLIDLLVVKQGILQKTVK